MNKEKTNKCLRKCKKTLSSFSHVVFTIVVYAVVFFPVLLFCDLCVASGGDYETYVKEQQEKTKILTAPYQAQIREIIKNVEKRQAQPDIRNFKKEVLDVAKNQCPMQKHLDQQDQKPNFIQFPIMIFVSFSMPKESIKAWIAQAQKVHSSVYIRGLVENSFKETAKAVSELVQDQSGGLVIDPNLFKKYSITQVPAVVVTNENNFDVIYGDVSLDYALEKINKFTQGSERKNLLDAIKKLRGTNTKNV